MQPQRSPKKSKFLSRFFVFLLIFVLTMTALFLGNSYYRIRNVEVIGQGINSKNISTEELIGKNLIFLDQSKTREELLRNNPQIKDLNVYKKYPDTLQIKAIVESQIAKLIVDQGVFYLSEAGTILKKEKDTNKKDVPAISFYQKLSYLGYQPGEAVTFNDIKMALSFITKLNSLGFEVRDVAIGGLNMIRLNLKEGVILVTTEKDQKIQIYQLEKIVKQFKIEGKSFQTLDLRFDKPIVKLK